MGVDNCPAPEGADNTNLTQGDVGMNRTYPWVSSCLRNPSQPTPTLFTPIIILFALIGLVLSPLAVAHASSSSADSVHFTTPNGELMTRLSFSPDGTLIAIGGIKEISDGN